MRRPNRILITRTDRIGDLVVSTPIFQMIREKFPQAHVAVCIFREQRELIQGNPFVDEIFLYEKLGREKNWLGQLRFSQMIRLKKFDTAIHLHATNRMHIMSWLAGIPIRIGYNRRVAWALTQVHPYDKKEGRKHESEYLFDLVSAALSLPAGVAPLPLPFVPVSAGALLSVQNLLSQVGVTENKKLVVIHPSASDASKMWPAEKFAELIKLLGTESASGSYLRWISVGDSKASEQTQKISALSGVPVINLCRELSLGMLAALFKKSQLVISNDSGPAHIAAAVGTPTVSVFGRWQPGLNAERWCPMGKHVAVVTPEIQNIPVEQRQFSYVNEITVQQVMHAVNVVLESGKV